MTFTPIDPAVWPRAQIFYYFSQMAPTGYSLTVELDVTALRRTLKQWGLKFYPSYLWLVTKNLNADPAFRLAWQGEQLGVYDTLTPLYAVFHEDDHTFSMMWTEFDPDFSAFYQAFTENQARYGTNHGFLAQPETPPPANAYTVSCVPWVSFQHFAVHSYGLKDYFFPSVEAGKFVFRNSRCFLPLSLTCHHATTDGYHVGRFLERIQADMNSFEAFLPGHRAPLTPPPLSSCRSAAGCSASSPSPPGYPPAPSADCS